jgi:SDR family mycofactocin-dependent oxidoreductase
MGRVEGKVALITGGARGQGRAHAIKLAEEGANIVLTDICAAPAPTDYEPATPEDMSETVALVEKTGAKVIYSIADVRDLAAMEDLVARTIAEFGRLDIVIANAGIVSWGRFWEMSYERWRDLIDINLHGVYHILRAAAPAMIAAGNGGSIIVVSSAAGIKSVGGQAHYATAKHGIVGLAKAAALELAPYEIRVNTLHPWAVRTHMGELGPEAMKILEDNPSYPVALGQLWHTPTVSEPEDMANSVLFLASDDSKTMTAAQLTPDHGASKV